MSDDEKGRTHQRWAHLRFSIVGPLLAAPPARGELEAELKKLAGKQWLHPVTGQPSRFSVSTIQRWYYTARAEKQDPVGVLRHKIRSDDGQQRLVKADLARLLEASIKRTSVGAINFTSTTSVSSLRPIRNTAASCRPIPPLSVT
jgi:hypothetical protein